MTTQFAPRLDILTPPQRRLWGQMIGIPDAFTLYGGTAIAMQLGHRVSVDFDFFADADIDHRRLLAEVTFLHYATILQQDKNTLTCLVDLAGPVRVSFFELPNLRIMAPPLISAGNGLKIASLLDLAGTKASVVQRRAEAKDYLDLDALMTAGIGLPLALAAAQVIDGPTFNPQITPKALSYFGDGDLPGLPKDVKARLAAAALAVDLDALPELPRAPR